MGKFNLKKLDGGDRFAISKSLGLDNIRVELTWEKGGFRHASMASES